MYGSINTSEIPSPTIHVFGWNQSPPHLEQRIWLGNVDILMTIYWWQHLVASFSFSSFCRNFRAYFNFRWLHPCPFHNHHLHQGTPYIFKHVNNLLRPIIDFISIEGLCHVDNYILFGVAFREGSGESVHNYTNCEYSFNLMHPTLWPTPCITCY